MKNIALAAVLCLFFLLPSSAPSLGNEEFCSMHADSSLAAVGPLWQEPPPSPGPHGPFQGKKFCYNVGKNKNCECFRDCVNGVPAKEQKCKNFCFEDKCKCKTKCQT